MLASSCAILWEYWSGIDQKISTVCCGWVNRGLANQLAALRRSGGRPRLRRGDRLWWVVLSQLLAGWRPE